MFHNSLFFIFKMTKKHCYTCGSKKVISMNNKQRYKCNDCGQLYTWRNELKSKEKQLVWFKHWVLQHQTSTFQNHQDIANEPYKIFFMNI